MDDKTGIGPSLIKMTIVGQGCIDIHVQESALYLKLPFERHEGVPMRRIKHRLAQSPDKRRVGFD